MGVVAERGEVEAAALDDPRQLTERLGERSRAWIRVDEYERPPDIDRDGQQRERRRVEARLPLGARSAAQRAVEPVGPGVIRALQRLAAPRVAHDEVAAVTTDVDERPQHQLAVAHDDHRDMPCPRGEEGRRLGDLLGGPGVLPRPRKDAARARGRQRPRPSTRRPAASTRPRADARGRRCAFPLRSPPPSSQRSPTCRGQPSDCPVSQDSFRPGYGSR